MILEVISVLSLLSFNWVHPWLDNTEDVLWENICSNLGNPVSHHHLLYLIYVEGGASEASQAGETFVTTDTLYKDKREAYLQEIRLLGNVKVT